VLYESSLAPSTSTKEQTHNSQEDTMGGKPNPGTKRDRRLKSNKRKSKKGKK
jgi:hypothetical protein